MKNTISPQDMEKRLRPREEDIRGPYFRDMTAIIHSGAFRRLKHKTQAFFAPQNDHICTRIEHVLHVATIAETICRGLNNHGWELNPEIANAAGLGHDLGHAPFGHSGEKAIDELIGKDKRFEHEINSLRVVDSLANDGRGLNLTFAVRDAILCHCGEKFEQYLYIDDDTFDLYDKLYPSRKPATYEGIAVRFADKIAYLGRDIEDALTAHVIKEDDIPKNIKEMLGHTNGKIINNLVIDLIENSVKMGKMGFSDKCYTVMNDLSKFNYKKIYYSLNKVNNEDYCINIINHLFNHLYNNFDEIVGGSRNITIIDKSFAAYVLDMEDFYAAECSGKMQIVIDYVSGMTDNYALESYKELTLPKPVTFFYEN